MDIDSYAWLIYIITFLLTFSIFFIFVLIIVKCVQTCIETRLFCFRRKRSRHGQAQGQSNTNSSCQDSEMFSMQKCCMACMGTMSSDSDSDSNETDPSDSSSESAESCSEDERNNSDRRQYTLRPPLILHDISLVSVIDHSSVYATSAGYENRAFTPDFEVVTTNATSTSRPNRPHRSSIINRKYDDHKRRCAQSKRRAAIVTATASSQQTKSESETNQIRTTPTTTTTTMATSKTKSALRTAITSISNSIKYPPLINEPQLLSSSTSTAIHRPLEPANIFLNTEISSRQQPLTSDNSNSPSSSSPNDALILKPSSIDPIQTAVVWLDNDEDDNVEDDDVPSFLATAASAVFGMPSVRCARPNSSTLLNEQHQQQLAAHPTSSCNLSNSFADPDIIDADDEIPPTYEQVVNESAL